MARLSPASFTIKRSAISICLAVITSDIDDQALRQLQRMHNDFVAEHPRWNDRIEIAFICRIAALQTFRTQRSTIAIISLQ